MKELLPFYLNGSLSRDENQQIEAWLRQDLAARQELASWREIQLAVSGQDGLMPTNRAYQALMDRIQSSPEQVTVSSRLRLQPGKVLGALLITLIVLYGLWKAVAPGIALEWSLQGEGVSAFKVYRATAGQAQFDLISEIPARVGTDRYSYVDVHLLPGKDYIYRVEGIGLAGDLAASKSIVSNSMGVLPGQLAVLLASLLVGLWSVNIFSSFSRILWNNLDRPQFS